MKSPGSLRQVSSNLSVPGDFPAAEAVNFLLDAQGARPGGVC